MFLPPIEMKAHFQVLICEACHERKQQVNCVNRGVSLSYTALTDNEVLARETLHAMVEFFLGPLTCSQSAYLPATSVTRRTPEECKYYEKPTHRSG